MDLLNSVFGTEMPVMVKMLIAFAATFGILAVIWLIFRAFGPSSRVRGVGARSRQPRLGVLDAHAVDARRKLVLIRRDNVEHLIMIGGPNDVVIESTILRQRPQQRPAAHAAPAAPPPPPSVTNAVPAFAVVEELSPPVAAPAPVPAAKPAPVAAPVVPAAATAPAPAPAPAPRRSMPDPREMSTRFQDRYKRQNVETVAETGVAAVAAAVIVEDRAAAATPPEPVIDTADLEAALFADLEPPVEAPKPEAARTEPAPAAAEPVPEPAPAPIVEPPPAPKPAAPQADAAKPDAPKPDVPKPDVPKPAAVEPVAVEPVPAPVPVEPPAAAPVPAPAPIPAPVAAPAPPVAAEPRPAPAQSDLRLPDLKLPELRLPERAGEPAIDLAPADTVPAPVLADGDRPAPPPPRKIPTIPLFRRDPKPASEPAAAPAEPAEKSREADPFASLEEEMASLLGRPLGSNKS